MSLAPISVFENILKTEFIYINRVVGKAPHAGRNEQILVFIVIIFNCFDRVPDNEYVNLLILLEQSYTRSQPLVLLFNAVYQDSHLRHGSPALLSFTLEMFSVLSNDCAKTDKFI